MLLKLPQKVKQFLQPFLFLYCIALQSHFYALAADQPLKFVVPDLPPYTYLKDGKVAGLGVEKIKLIMARAKLNYTIDVVKDYSIAMLLMKKGKADGMFLASKNSERNTIASFTKPLLTNRWCWYFKAGSGLTPLKRRFKRIAKVGTILNTNTNKWLRKNGYRVAGKPDNATALNKMLLTNRVNAVFVSEAVFELVIPKEDYPLYNKIIAVEKPFGIYINKQYIKKHPEIMEKLNNIISAAK